jgi:hypothetical protein
MEQEVVMAKRVRSYQNNFTKGEMDPSMWGHGDLDGYYEGLSSAENVWVTGSGSAAKRYGLVAVRRYTGAPAVRMYPFTSVSGHRYVIIVTVGRIDVVVAGSEELVASVDAAIITGDIILDLNGISYQNSVIFTHNGIQPQLLKYNGGNNFTLSGIEFTNVPSFEFRVDDVRPVGVLTVSGASGFVSVSSSVGAFLSTDVGKYVTILPVGRLRIMKVISVTAASGYLEESLFDHAAVASGDWTIERGWEPLWGGAGGYPAVAGFHDGRLILGNFERARSVFAYSVINSPFDFSMGDGTAAYGGWRILSSDQGEEVCHIVSEHGLYFFCGGGEYFLLAPFQGS